MTRVRKVLLVVENRPAPADARVWPEALSLRNAGYQVSIISPKGLAMHRESHTCIDGIHIYRYHLPSGRGIAGYLIEYSVSLLMSFWLSLRVWVCHGFDAIHAANPPDMFFLLGLLYRPFGKKYIFDQHDVSPDLFQVLFARGDTTGPRNRLMHVLRWALLRCERWSYQVADLVIATNLSFRRLAIERGRCRADKIVVVRNGPDLRRFTRGRPEPELKMGRRHLLAYLGVMSVQDGVENALYALDNLVHRRGRQDVGLVLMGAGDALAGLQQLAHELALDEYVKFNGRTAKEDVVRYLTVADIGLVPDPQNGMNELCTMIKTMEYMAMEVPVVAFDLVETRYSAENAALYATPNSVEDFANKIAYLLDREELRRTMGAQGRKRVEDSLSWDHSKEQLVQAYCALFNQPVAEAKPVQESSFQPVARP